MIQLYSGNSRIMNGNVTKKCKRRGCLKEYIESENPEGCCTYHPGKPMFHDTKKGWDCCKKTA